MATLEQIAVALRRAHEAGDVEGARKLARAYQAMQGQARTEQAGFLESFRESALGLAAAPEAAKFALAEQGQSEARRALLKAQESKKERTSFEDVKDLSSLVDWAKQTAGSSAGQLVAPAAVATAGKLLTKAPGAAKALGYGTLGAQYLLENLGRQAQEQESAVQRGEGASETSLAKAGAAAAGQTALDAVGIKFFKPLFGRFPFLKNLLGESGSKTAKEAEDALLESVRNGTLSRGKGIFTGAAKGAAFEVPQEIAQTILERAQAGLSLTDQEARREYTEALAGAVLLGSPLGGVSQYYQNKEKLEEAQRIQLARDIQREEERQTAETQRQEALKTERETTRETKREEAKAKIGEKLDNARNVLFGLTTPDGAPLTTETESGQFERALIGSGVPAVDASKIIKRLEKNGVLTPINRVTGIRSIVPEAKEYDLTKTEVKEEPVKKEPEKKAAVDETIPYTAPATTAAAPTGTVEAVTSAPIGGATDVTTGTTDVTTRLETPAAATGEADVAAGGTSTAQFIQQQGAGRPATTEPTATRVVDTGEPVERLAGREERVKPALTEAKLEKWQERFEQTKSRFAPDDPESPINLLERINRLKTELPAGEDLNYVNEIQDVVSYLKKGTDLETIADKLGMDMSKLESYLNDLRQPLTKEETQGIIDENNKPIPEAFASKKTEQGRKIPSAYERFLLDNETPLVTVNRSLDNLIEKYDAEDVINNTGELRGRIRERLDQIENAIADDRARAVKRRADEAELLGTETETEFQQREAKSKTRAQRMFGASDDVLTYSSADFGNVLQSGNANNVLDYIAQRAAQNQRITPESGEVVSRFAENEANKVRPQKVDTTGLTPEQAQKKIDAAKRKAQAEAARVRAGVEAELLGSTLDISSLQFNYQQKNRFAQELAKRLRELNFSNVEIITETSPNADPEVFADARKKEFLAWYNPKTNKIYVTKEGMTPKIVLHEMIHAATVKVLSAYLDPARRGSLTVSQREAAEHLVKIYDFAKTRLSLRFPNAFEDVYEFVTYAMTDPEFQRELVRVRRPSLAKYTNIVQDLWEQFTDALSRMFNLLTPAEVRLMLKERGRKGAAEKILRREKRSEKSGVTDKETLATARLREAMSQFEEARRDPEGNLLLEVSEGFHQILTPPEAGIETEALPAKAAPPAQEREVSKIKTEYRRRLEDKHPTEPAIRGAARFLKTHEGSEWLIRKFQNDRRPLKTLQDILVRTGKLIVGEKNFNNLYSLISLSSGNAFHIMTQYFQKDMHDVHQAVEAYAKARNLNLMDALSDLNLYLIAKHEPERRLIKYLRNVPLDNSKLITYGGVTKTAAEHRRAIFDMLRTDKVLSKDQALALRDFVESLAGYKNGQKVGNGYVDAKAGKSLDPRAKPGKYSDDINDGVYNVAGEFTPSELANLRSAYERDPQKVLIDRMIQSMKRIQDNTIARDKQANYWSQPVENIVNFYNFQNYVPLKGKPGQAETEDESDYNYTGKRLSGELAETAQSFEGRISDADNVIMQTLVDGAKSAMRAGRKDVTQAIKNLINQKSGLLEGKILTKKPIPFADREKELDRSIYKGDDKIYHYNEDGSVEVIQITDRKMLESIRRVYREKSPFIDMANRITSGIGQSHTRYNPAFHPYNFVRDVLTNAFTLGAERGPEWTQRFLNNVSTRVAQGGMMKAGKISRMYADGDVKGIEKLAKEDPFAASILEYLQEGGRVSYVQGLAIRGQIDELVKDINRGKWVRGKEKIDRWVDIWSDVFELTSRAAAYETAKAEALARGVSERAARQEAAAYAKNLANFEQVGEWGRQAGALYMFFRPAATGAVRAIDALTPAFLSEQTAVDRLPEQIRKDAAAVSRFRANFRQEKKNAQAMALGLLGAGFTLYVMAFMAADDDELGRNKVATEDMSLWTRNLRLPLSFTGIDKLKDTFVQLPWGFGLGSFGAMGAQVGGMAMGTSSLADGLANAVTIGLDSFLPLPVARFDPTTNFPAWMLDSMAPSLVRPFLEYTMNVDTFGREIYNNRISKYGDAFTGGRHIPELYSQAARKLFEVSNAQVDVSPNTMYFFANNYVDGLTRILHNGHGMFLTLFGQKEFDPKRDLVFMDSFFGKKASYDAREFAKVEQDIQEREQRLRTVKDRPELLQRYLESNPNDPALVYIYNKLKNQQLKKIREEMNKVKASDLPPKERQVRLKELERLRDMTMRGIIDTFKQYGLEP